MTDSPTPVPNPNNDPAKLGAGTPIVPAPRKKKRLWLKLLGIVVVLIVLLVLLLPTIASLGFVRGIVESKVNDNLNGSVSIGSYSLGWLGGISASDVKVFDANKQLILQLKSFKTDMTLLQAIRGNYALGNTTADIDLTHAEIDDGQLNYSKLAKSSSQSSPKASSEPAEPKPDAAPKPEKPSKLPAVSGKITVTYSGAVFNGADAQPLVKIQPGQTVIDIPNINQPITNDITLAYSVSDGAVGTLHLVGSAGAIKDNEIDLKDASIDQKLNLSQMDLAAINALHAIIAPTLQLKAEGIANGDLAINMKNGSDLSSKGQINVTKFSASGAPLKGKDQLAIATIAIPVDIAQTTTDGKQTVNANVAIQLGNKSADDLGKIHLTANGSEDAMLAAAKLVPGVLQHALAATQPTNETLTVAGSGTAKVSVNVDVAAFVSQLPETVALQKGVELKSGHFTNDTNVDISNDTVKFATDTKLPDVAGTNGGKPITVSPIDFSAGATAVGGTTLDLRDLAVKVTSSFLQASGGGPGLSQEKIDGNFDLAKLQAEAQQFVDLDAMANPPSTQPNAPAHTPFKLVGSGTFELATAGNLIQPAGTGKITGNLTIAGLDANGVGTLPPLAVQSIVGTLGGDLTRFTSGDKSGVSYKNLAAAMTASGITVTGKTASTPILNNETIKLGALLNSSADGKDLTGNGSLDTRFMNATLANLDARTGAATTWDILQKIDIDVHVPDLPTADKLLNAFSAPPEAKAAAFAPDSQLAPMLVDADVNAARLILVDDAGQQPDETKHDYEVRRKREKAEKAKKQAEQKQPAAAAAAPAAADDSATAAADTALPPLEVTSGSADLKISVAHDDAKQTTAVTLTNSITNLALKRGDKQYAFARPVSLNLAAAVKAAADPAQPTQPLMSQIQQLQVTSMDGDLVVAKVSMPQPVTVTNLGDPQNLDAKGTVKLDGSFADATPLLAVYQNAKPMPYAGTYDFNQQIGTGTGDQGKLIRLTGDGSIANFQVLDDAGKPAVTEPKVDIKDDLDYLTIAADAKSGKAAVEQAIIRTLSINMTTSQAMAATFTGRIINPSTKREFRGLGTDPTAKLDTTYDLAKLWPIIYPTLAVETQTKYKDLKIAGKKHEVIALSGYYPVAGKSYESMAHLNADGALALDLLDLPQGLTITSFDLPFSMKNGVIQTAPGVSQPTTQLSSTQKSIVAKTALANDGAVDLSEITIDLGKKIPLLSISKNHALLQDVKLNPVLADSLGAATLIFKDATKAAGLINMTVMQCNQVPYSDLFSKAPRANAAVTYNITDLEIDGPLPTELSKELSLGGQGIHGGLENGSLTLAGGVATNSFTIDMLRYKKAKSNGNVDETDSGTDSPDASNSPNLKPVHLPIVFSGGIVLATEALKDFNIHITGELISGIKKQWGQALPNGATIPITGTVSHFNVDIVGGISKSVTSNLGGALGGLLNKKSKGGDSSDNNSDQPAKQSDPLGGLLNSLEKKKK